MCGFARVACAWQVNDVMFPGLPVPLQVSQVLLSHTPMKALVPQFRDKVVLVGGRGNPCSGRSRIRSHTQLLTTSNPLQAFLPKPAGMMTEAVEHDISCIRATGAGQQGLRTRGQVLRLPKGTHTLPRV